MKKLIFLLALFSTSASATQTFECVFTNFSDQKGLGNIMSTTIDTKMHAVHSRNSVGILGELLPSQYYGSCVAI